MCERRCCSWFIPVAALLVTLLSWPNPVRDIFLGPVPALSPLASFDWQPGIAPTDEDVAIFRKDGYVVLRQAIDPAGIDTLLAEAQTLCTWQFIFHRACYVRQSRWINDIFRDFLFHGPVPDVVSKFVTGRGVRVVQDGIFGHQHWFPFLPPWIAALIPHVDHGGQAGIYGRLHSNTSGVSAWMPLHDIDVADGGSITVYEKFVKNDCHVLYGGRPTENRDVDVTQIVNPCHTILLNHSILLNFSKGDLLLFNPNMLHHGQAVETWWHKRYAWHAWFVDTDAMNCFPRDCWNRGEPCCEVDEIKSGARLHSACYPQVHPAPLKHEVEAHFGSSAQPMITRRPTKVDTTDLRNLAPECLERINIISS